MKKTTVKTKLLLRKETTRVLLEKDLALVGAGQGGPDDGGFTHAGTTCLGARDRN